MSTQPGASVTVSCVIPRRSIACNFSVHVPMSWSIVSSSTVLPNRRCVLKKKLSNKEVLKKTPLVLLALLSFVFALWAQKDQPPAKAPEYKIPPRSEEHTSELQSLRH